jgi:hypothetical protein
MGKQEMTRVILRFRGISTIFLLGIVLLSGRSICQPKLAIAGGTELDFGEIYTGKKFIKNLPIYNIGTDTLVILNTSASCGCTVALMSHDRIAPKDSALLAITFNSSHYSGPTTKSIDIASNDPAQKNVHVVFKTFVIKTFDLQPDYVVFRTTLDSIPMDTVTLKNTSPFPVKILSTQASTPEVKISTSTNTLQPGETSYILLSFKPASVGTIKGDLTIKTDNDHLSTLDIRYFGMVMRNKSH